MGLLPTSLLKKYRKQATFLGLMSASVGLPLAAVSPDLQTIPGKLSALMSSAQQSVATPKIVDENGHAVSPAPAAEGVERLVIHPDAAPLEGFTAVDLGEVLRFDISPEWVYSRWSRKTTALADLQFHGVRVPLVTGTAIDDLAGSLTYYFNRDRQPERIVFQGRTGDARKVIALVTQRYGLLPQRAFNPGEQLYQLRWNDTALSELRVRPASVVWASAPHANYEVSLDLQRPGASRYLPSSAPTASMWSAFGR
jgi:hypothetical protein